MAAKRSAREINEARRAGRRLAGEFTDGKEPEAVAVRMVLLPGEICVGHTEVQVFRWLEGDGEYIHKSGGYYGAGLAGKAMLGTATAIGNQFRRAVAARAAAPQWRPLDQGDLYLTS